MKRNGKVYNRRLVRRGRAAVRRLLAERDVMVTVGVARNAIRACAGGPATLSRVGRALEHFERTSGAADTTAWAIAAAAVVSAAASPAVTYFTDPDIWRAAGNAEIAEAILVAAAPCRRT